MQGKIIQPGEPIAVGWKNFRRYVRNVRKQELMLIEFELSEEDWMNLSTLPRDGSGELGIVWTDKGGLYDSDDAPETEAPTPVKKRKAKKEPAGPFAVFWYSIQKQGFFNYRPVNAAVTALRQSDDEDIKHTLLRIFNVDTRAAIDPEKLRKWLRSIIKARDVQKVEIERIAQMLDIAEKRLVDAVQSEARQR